jgi:ubiquinone/menaquinone biosynthesis C-methylase UbiE
MTTTGTVVNVYGKTYGGNAPEAYQRYFVPAIGLPLATDLVRTAALREGERVLDVACGTGVVSRLAAAIVGGKGRVAGADINPAMLQTARSASEETEPSIAWYETSAEAMPLGDASFDVVLCQLGLQFMSDKNAALREMRRVLVPGGRVFVTVPQPPPFFEVMQDAMEKNISPDAAAFVRAVFSLDDSRELEQLLQQADFSEVRVLATQKEFRLPPAGDFLWQYIHSTPLSAAVMAMDEHRRDALHRDVVEGWRPWSNENGMSYRQGILIGSGTRGQVQS